MKVRTPIAELPDIAIVEILRKYLSTLNYRRRRYAGARIPFSRAQLVQIRILAEQRQLEWACSDKRPYAEPPEFLEYWATSNVIDSADSPFLPDALMDAGCDDSQLLNHLLAPMKHTWNCWARCWVKDNLKNLAATHGDVRLRDLGSQHLLNILLGDFAGNRTQLEFEVRRRGLWVEYERQRTEMLNNANT